MSRRWQSVADYLSFAAGEPCALLQGFAACFLFLLFIDIGFGVAFAGIALMTTVIGAHTYSVVADWLKLPTGREQLGNQHGDIAVSSAGEVYVSVQDPAAGLQVFSPEGAFLRNVPGAPSDFHGFVIRKQPDGEFIYGATLRGQTIVKMTLDGTIIFTIGSSAIPARMSSSASALISSARASVSTPWRRR